MVLIWLKDASADRPLINKLGFSCARCPMGKPEAPKNDATSSGVDLVEQNRMKERRQAVEEYIRSLREFLKRLREKLH